MKIVFASHTFLGGPFKVGSHQLARALVNLGHTVLHISTPVTPLHLLRGEIARQRCRESEKEIYNVSPKLYEWIPRLWFPAGRLFYRNSDLSLLLQAPKLTKLLKQSEWDTADIVFIDQPKLAGLAALITSPRWVYRPTDLYAEMGDGALAHRLERRILGMVDGVVATSKVVLDDVLTRAPRSVSGTVMENGVDLEHFSAPQLEPSDICNIPRPRAIYVGALDQRFDWAGLVDAAAEGVDVQFVLIGPADGIAAARALPANVHVLGARGYEKIPAYIQASDVAIMPLSADPANRGRSPMKFYEYLAAGKMVVARATPELRRRGQRNIFLYEGEEFLTALRSALRQPKFDSVDSHLEALDWPRLAARLLEQSKVFQSRLAPRENAIAGLGDNENSADDSIQSREA